MNDLSFQISPTFTRKQARLAELGHILRQRSLTWDERQECKALEAEMRPARLARMFAEMPQMQPQPHDAHVQHWQARNRADEAIRGLITDAELRKLSRGHRQFNRSSRP